ncbi:3,4-dihydroxy-2-butanone-4-phosphate synthase [Melittangium boletus]|uniref:3,4-dihydroxy-2-butanone 4-phosphate synthase n=1 Tax=Melittangium boletus DSM 14713 TaxID=1294270 RepID=A0A250IML6_9BACT|nr:3,4-dihydroxy-2-butanone-4-phosphate synthase [Melittangium boletus]ATB32493.1 3,4-dihydroxy-2-butanone-4-phosphate synthase [Melittangium boletus DSM 14713]
MAHGKQRETDSIALVERALAEIRKGRMVILTDDEDRENEGDLVMAAEKVTPQDINFMATHGRGLICLALNEERIRRLNLPLMVQDNTSSFQTAFTVSIEAAQGVSTGISAADRAHTIQVAVAPNAKPADLSRPGHIFPLRAREGGVLVRTGQTEGSVDLARMAGLRPAGVICEIMNADGSMARRPDLVKFARKHQMVLLSVADIIRYRLERERLVKRLGEVKLERRGQGSFQAYTYGSDVDNAVHVALVKGDLSGREPVLTRVHRSCLMGDVLGSAGCECGIQLERAFQRIHEAGRGVVVILQRDASAKNQLRCTHVPNEEMVPGHKDQTRLREFGVGAQILKDLRLTRLRLLTNNPKKIVGLESYSLEVVEQVPLAEASAPTRKVAARRPPRPRQVP